MSEVGYVLDASALLALMFMEPAADAVAAMLPGSRISAVNLSEVIAKLQERGRSANDIDRDIADLDVDVIPFDRLHAAIAGRLREATRRAGLSLGDRACLAAAQVGGAVAVTTDRAWAKLDLGIDIMVVR